ncbi:group I truncated hemoglobin [Noviherbaspirillum galbum]|uniref:Group 1 truncated hemoglobin n=1 Tax=Noviherbaspirillum galbum TaxID=2709383 RepID=A0A6B3SXJ1_9BURK|nr:group 1 truncated hemoglobin [Noviherbaspirillum galbum]NEX62489.1 group 1 truncated hemoglobin [Noviherbaspirillum galbum]
MTRQFQLTSSALAQAAAILAFCLPAAAHAQTAQPTSPAIQQASADDAVYQGLGGKAGIDKIVTAFLPIVLDDGRIKDSFKDVDMQRLGTKLGEQLCNLGGGPCKYTGKDMQVIHEDLRITRAQFYALAEDLQLAMERQGVPSRIQNRLMAKLAPMHRDIVTR